MNNAWIIQIERELFPKTVGCGHKSCQTWGKLFDANWLHIHRYICEIQCFCFENHFTLGRRLKMCRYHKKAMYQQLLYHHSKSCPFFIAPYCPLSAVKHKSKTFSTFEFATHMAHQRHFKVSRLFLNIVFTIYEYSRARKTYRDKAYLNWHNVDTHIAKQELFIYWWSKLRKFYMPLEHH